MERSNILLVSGNDKRDVAVQLCWSGSTFQESGTCFGFCFVYFNALYDGLNWVWQLHFASSPSDDAEVDEDANYSYAVRAGTSETVRRLRPLVGPNRRNKKRTLSHALFFHIFAGSALTLCGCVRATLPTLPEGVPMRAK